MGERADLLVVGDSQSVHMAIELLSQQGDQHDGNVVCLQSQLLPACEYTVELQGVLSAELLRGVKRRCF